MLAVFVMAASPQALGTSAKDLVAKLGAPETFSAEYGRILDVGNYDKAMNELVDPDTEGWKKALIGGMLPYLFTFYPVLAYATESYTIRDNVIYSITFSKGTKRALPFGLSLSDSLRDVISKVHFPPKRQDEDSVSWEGITLDGQSVDPRFGPHRGEPAIVIKIHDAEQDSSQ
jgi:hypothetical protein